MTDAERKLAAHFLRDLSERLGNAGCNDFDLGQFLSGEERERFVREYHEYNGAPQDFDPQDLDLPDFCIVALLAGKLENDP